MDALTPPQYQIVVSAGPFPESKWAKEWLTHMYLSYLRKHADVESVDSGNMQGTVLSFAQPELYEKLKKESGIHRFIRTCPTDEKQRRFTTCVEVQVTSNGKLLSNFTDHFRRSYVFDPYQLVSEQCSHIKADPAEVYKGEIDRFLDYQGPVDYEI